MPLTDTMSFAEAAAYQAAFDAVANGTATPAQAQDVDAVINAVGQMMRPLGARAGAIIDARINLLAGVPEALRAAVVATLDGKDAAPAALAVYRLPDGNALVGTADEVAARIAEDAAAKVEPQPAPAEAAPA